MIDRETALELAQTWFEIQASSAPDMAFSAVDEKKIIEASFAWILPWNDRRFLAGDIRYERQGHSPLAVLKSDGTVMRLPKLTVNEWTQRKPQKLWGSMEDRITKLAQELGIKDA